MVKVIIPNTKNVKIKIDGKSHNNFFGLYLNFANSKLTFGNNFIIFKKS